MKNILAFIAVTLLPLIVHAEEDPYDLPFKGDHEAAYREYLPLAQQGDASAQNNLGVMYANGEGVPQDYTEAMRWFRRAAEQGHVKAQLNLGLMYASGNGVPQDYVQAYFWYNLAAIRGNQTAMNRRDIIAKKMSPAQIEQAQLLAQEWRPRPEH